MIIVQLKCPECKVLQLYHSEDFEDGVIMEHKEYCPLRGREPEAWQIPHRPIVAIDNNLHITDMTDLKWEGKDEFSPRDEYPYYNDSLELSYSKFIECHKEWRKQNK